MVKIDTRQPGTLTENERFALRNPLNTRSVLMAGAKALAFIDAHAADRAALVAQLEAAEREMRSSHRVCENLLRERDAAEAQVAELTRERDEARDQLKDARRWFRINGKKFIASPVAADELEEIIRGK